jgi:hypothetical protein
MRGKNLCAETIERAAGALEGVYDVEGGDGFPLGVLGVCYRVADDLRDKGDEGKPRTKNKNGHSPRRF